MIRRSVRSIVGDRKGATLIEFAIVAPVMVLLIMGLCDLCYRGYAQSILDGAIQKAGRDAGIQGGADNTVALDTTIIRLMTPLMRAPTEACAEPSPAGCKRCTTPAPGGSWCSTRKSYSTFSKMKPEYIYEKHGNSVYDPDECFDDVNNNKTWEADPGLNGQGGASDIAMYTMSITYPRLFPMAGLMGWSSVQTISAKTILKNQPYASQAVPTVIRVCPPGSSS